MVCTLESWLPRSSGTVPRGRLEAIYISTQYYFHESVKNKWVWGDASVGEHEDLS